MIVVVVICEWIFDASETSIFFTYIYRFHTSKSFPVSYLWCGAAGILVAQLRVTGWIACCRFWKVLFPLWVFILILRSVVLRSFLRKMVFFYCKRLLELIELSSHTSYTPYRIRDTYWLLRVHGLGKRRKSRWWRDRGP